MTLEITVNLITLGFIVLWCIGGLSASVCLGRVFGCSDDVELFKHPQESLIDWVIYLSLWLIVGNFFWWNILKHEVENG